VILYAESSALLSWLLGEAAAPQVSEALKGAEHVAVSDLGILECDRAILRGVTISRMDQATAAERRARLEQAAARWHRLRITQEIIERARHPFPVEPLRTLDALHLASALAVRPFFPGIGVLSLDERIRNAARPLGFQVYPG